MNFMFNLLKSLKRVVNNYTYLYCNVSFLIGSFSFKKYRKLRSDLKKLNSQAEDSHLLFPVTKLFPCYKDADEDAGFISNHYFLQDLYVAQRVYVNKPAKHIDIGSRIDGFVTHVASFRKIEVYDIRPFNLEISNIIFTQADLMNSQALQENITDSISCLHALEHFGLGRYGDPIFYEGYLVGFFNISKMLSSGGVFYFSVPLGEQRIEFHAHRVFSLRYLIDFVSEEYNIIRFSYIDDSNHLYVDVAITNELIQDNCGCHFGCAIFELLKK